MNFQPITSPEIWQQTLCHLPNAHALQSWTWAEFKSRWGWQMRPVVLTEPDGGGHEERPLHGERPLAAAMILKRPLPRLPFSILYVPKGPVFDYANEALRGLVLAELEQIARQERGVFIKIDPDVVKGW
ncbi:MAG TPA: peptidoglycan bridge formation glycyltransferase FemA/FemB family protein, partial [Chloroflexota bacterium]|nr:peptidoglycan bridge formation glycyltransferase FemA/FemB family protein [Chloroflexota bacterium]